MRSRNVVTCHRTDDNRFRQQTDDSRTDDKDGPMDSRAAVGALEQAMTDAVEQTESIPVADVLAALAVLRRVRAQLDGWERQLIAGARRSGASWAELAPVLGVASRQAAERRFLRLAPDSGAHPTTRDQRVRAVRDQR